MVASIREIAIQPCCDYNRHLHRWFVANRSHEKTTGLAVTEDLCSRIISLPEHDTMASEGVVSVIVAVEDGHSR